VLWAALVQVVQVGEVLVLLVEPKAAAAQKELEAPSVVTTSPSSEVLARSPLDIQNNHFAQILTLVRTLLWEILLRNFACLQYL